MIQSGFSLLPGRIINISLDPCNRQLVNGVKLETIFPNDPVLTKKRIVNALNGKILKDVTPQENYPGVTWIGKDLIHMTETYIGEDGVKNFKNYVYYIDEAGGGYIYRVPHMIIEVEGGGKDVITEASPETYNNILRYIFTYRKEDVLGLFIQIDGTFHNFLEFFEKELFPH